MNTKIPAYKGTASYIFLIYSYKDSEEVMKDIAWMNENGYRAWLSLPDAFFYLR